MVDALDEGPARTIPPIVADIVLPIVATCADAGAKMEVGTVAVTTAATCLAVC